MSFWTRSIASVWRNVRNTLQLLPPDCVWANVELAVVVIKMSATRYGARRSSAYGFRRLLGNNDGVSRLENQVPSELSFFHEIIVVEREVDEPAVDVPNHENIIQFRKLLKTSGERERLGDADGSRVGESTLLGDFAENEKLRAVGLFDADGHPRHLHEAADGPFELLAQLHRGSSGHQNVAAVALPLGLFGESSYPLFISIASLSMMMTPLMIQVARPVARTMSRAMGRPPKTEDGHGLDTIETHTDHVVIIGYGLAGRYLSRAVQASRIACVVIDQNIELVQRAREDGIPAVFGDGAQPAVLEHVGIADARVIVFAISSPADELRGVELARMLNPSARIIVRTRYVRAIDRLMAHGATEVVVEEFEASLELFARALESYEIPLNRIWRELESLRSEHYAVLRDADPGSLKLDALKHLGIHDALELVEVEDGSAAVNENARTLDLRRRTGAIQVAVVRDGQPIYRRDPDFHYQVGDTTVIVGDRESLERATLLFQAAE